MTQTIPILGSDDTFAMIWSIRSPGEQYRLQTILRGHQGDILDVAWSGDGKYLATCSIDNSIIVWNARSFPQITATLKGHTDMVKGVTWDPVGKYLASQSTDKTLRVWRRNDWKEEVCIKAPFEKCGSTTHVLRLSWSPDGKYIISSHALNNSGPVAEIIQRENWSTGINFVGHRKAIEVVRFNSNVFVKAEQGENHGCVAMGGKDRSLSVWLTSLKRPLLVLHDLFTKSVVDITWSLTGYEVMASSLDGTVVYLSFNEKEIGRFLPKDQLNSLYERLYGISPNAASSTDYGVIEDPQLLKFVDNEPTVENTPDKMEVQGSQAEIPDYVASLPSFSSKSSNQRTIINQIETRTKDGRRRITPTLVSQPIRPVSSPSNQKPSSSLTPPPAPDVGNTHQCKQPEVSVGSTAIQPEKKANLELNLNIEASSSVTAAVIRPLPQIQPGTKRKNEDEKTTGKKSKRAKTEATVVTTPHKMTQRYSSVSTTAKLSVPELKGSLQIQLSIDGKGVSLEVENKEKMATLKCFSEGDTRPTWSAALVQPALCIAGSYQVVVAAGKSGIVQLFSSSSGRSLIPPFSLPSPPAALVCKKQYILIVTTDAAAWLWDVKSMKPLLHNVPVSPLISNTETLSNLAISDNGHAVVTLESQNMYVYHMDMGVWIQIANPSEISKYSSNLKNINPSSGPLAALQFLAAKNSTLTTQISNQQFIEHQITRAEMLSSPAEYLHWCTMYITEMTKEGNENKIREFFYKILNSSQKKFVGFFKQVLLDKILPPLAANPNLQRLYSELKQAQECDN